MGQITNPSSSGGGSKTGGTRLSFVLAAGANNNVTPVGFVATVGRLDLDSTAGVANITGLLAGADGQQVLIRVKPGGNNVTLNNLNGGSLAANQFSGPDDIVLTPGTALLLMYYGDAINNWVMVP